MDADIEFTIMSQNYEIFFRRHAFVFGSIDSVDFVPDLIINNLRKSLIKNLFEDLRSLKLPQKILIAEQNGYELFKGYFKCITAAGGGVFNPKGELLLIHRLGLWDLPKGKMEKYENPSGCALREVEEECNVFGLEIKRELKSTLHIYFQKKWFLKKTHWFEMTSSQWEKAIPQYDEDIDAVEWRKPENINIEDLETYTTIKSVLHQLLPQQADI